MWEPPRDALEQHAGDRVAFGVGQRELLGVVGEQAQPVNPGVHQVVHDARGALQVNGLVVEEDRRHHRHDTGQRSVHAQVLQITVRSRGKGRLSIAGIPHCPQVLILLSLTSLVRIACRACKRRTTSHLADVRVGGFDAVRLPA
jgi:hypothetical protein